MYLINNIMICKLLFNINNIIIYKILSNINNVIIPPAVLCYFIKKMREEKGRKF